MFFIVLTFLAAFSIEGIGTYISVLGLAAIFASNPIIMVMAVVLDFAKLITVSFVYKKWATMNKVMRVYMLVASAILMTITSAGAFGYLSAEFQQAVIPNKESAIKMQSLTDEQSRLQARKVEIDKQIAESPQAGRGAVANRIRLINSFKEETARVNARLVEIDSELPKLKIADANVSAHTGPIAYVAEAFDTTMEKAVKYVILLIIFVFDPLAVSLILSGNFLINERDKKKKEVKVEPVASPPAVEAEPAQVDNPYTAYIQTAKGKAAIDRIANEIFVRDEQEEELELELVPIESEVEEPEPSVITRQQLDKLYKERLPVGEELIPKTLTVNKEVFTSDTPSDIIEVPIKGIMNSAPRHFPGAEVTFGPSPSTIVREYELGTLSKTPEVI